MIDDHEDGDGHDDGLQVHQTPRTEAAQIEVVPCGTIEQRSCLD